MKLVKLSVFALTMGLFVASCGNGSEAAKTADTMNAGAAKPADAAAAPAADAKKDEKKADAKMDAKKDEKKK